MENIRNFCVIAHIDHGKSTLADRFLELTKTVSERQMKNQLLDQMDLERERGITIKLQPVTMSYQNYRLNLIDTPGHIDFAYEVSRSLLAVEGAVLLVDAGQGVQAQTLANFYLAEKYGLKIVPVVNKIDLASARVDETVQELAGLVGCPKSEVLKISAKTGLGVEAVLKTVIEKIPAPKSKDSQKPLQALIFDSIYDDYRGVIGYLRLFSGTLAAGEKILIAAGNQGPKIPAEVLEVGRFNPEPISVEKLSAGEIGYLATGLRDLGKCRVGSTVLKADRPTELLAGYSPARPMVFAGIFCRSGDDFSRLRQAVEKISLNDAAFSYQPESSPALGFGFRGGFLGLLHLEIIQERLRREFQLEVVVTAPSVGYQIRLKNGRIEKISNPEALPEPNQIEKIAEPIMKLRIFTPKEFLGPVIKLAESRRANYLTTEYLGERAAVIYYEIPLSQLIIDFYDRLKSVSSGYASLNYDFLEYRPVEAVKMEILVAEEKVPALSLIVYRDQAEIVGRRVVKTLKEKLPRRQFPIKIQAAVGGKIVAAERLSALRKDVTAKLYGGDWSRRQKLLDNQRRGKKKMTTKGKAEIPPDAFLAVLKGGQSIE